MRWRRSRKTAAHAVSISATGKESQTPVMSKSAESAKAAGMMNIKPRISEMAKDSRGRSMPPKYTAVTILTPANTKPAKYRYSPWTAICVSCASLSRLKIFTMGFANSAPKRYAESRRRQEGEFHRLGGVFLLSLPQIAADHGLQALRDARKYGQHDERNIGDHAVRRNADVPVQS